MCILHIICVVVYISLIGGQKIPENVPGVLPGADEPIIAEHPEDRGQPADPGGDEGGGGGGGANEENQQVEAQANAAEQKQEGEEEEEYEEEEEVTTPKDNYTFVALIDIVFTDGCKRTCTGAIIHDNVVITAAHCFTMLRNAFLQPELSMSFVVIGTKAMFETGYEQYLPIERVVTHPRFKGWTADLALVYTFANMMSDKPGQIIPLASDKNHGPVDSNVTVFSWGRCKGDIYDNTVVRKKLRRDPERYKYHVTKALVSSEEHKSKRSQDKRRDNRILNNVTIHPRADVVGEEITKHLQNNLNKKVQNKPKFVKRVQPRIIRRTRPRLVATYDTRTVKRATVAARTTSKTTPKSRYLTSGEDKPIYEDADQAQKESSASSENLSRLDISSIFIHNKDVPDKFLKRLSAINTALQKHKHKKKEEIKEETNQRISRRYLRYGSSANEHDFSHYKSWRRQIGMQQNNLTVGVFVYVNIASCKKIIERSLPPLYEIQNKNEVLCYSSEEFFITNEDSGAPVVQADELVGITVGGVDTDGEHVAVGVRISCFCSWIAKSLPKHGNTNLNCCNGCCNGNSKGSRVKIKKQKHVNSNLPSSKISQQKQGIHKFVNGDGSDDEENKNEDIYVSSKE